MTDLLTRPETYTSTDTITDTETDIGEPTHAHYIDRGEDDRPSKAIILEAMVYGNVLTALCGHKWIPSRDPAKLPVCPKCEEMLPFELSMRGFNGNETIR